MDFRREAPNLTPNQFSREVFCPVLSPAAAKMKKRGDPGDKVGHFMWTYTETFAGVGLISILS